MTTSSQKVTIYTSPLCGYCHRAKRLLDDKNVSYQEIDVAFSPSERSEMVEKSKGRTTVPQIFICENHIGGCDDLYALDNEGKLDPLLQNCLQNNPDDAQEQTEKNDAG